MSTPTQCWLWYHGIGWFSLLLTPLCCDDTYDVTPRVSALAECDRLVSEPMEEKEEGKKRKRKSRKRRDQRRPLEMGSNFESSGYAASDNEVESDLESKARSETKCKEMEDTCESRQMQNIIPQIFMLVTNNMNNNNNNNDNSANNGNGRNNRCSYKGFLACNPRDYNGKGGEIALTHWIEKMKSVIDNSRCAENQKVKYAASLFINKALTWWNTQVQTRGHEAAIDMTWVEFKALSKAALGMT
ncbi:hypothetical protein Tco_1356152 [Tanacetum coccineum]